MPTVSATAEQLTDFYSKIYAYWDSQVNICKSSGDTSSTSHEWSVYYADLSSRAAHHYNKLKDETLVETQRRLAEEEREKTRREERLQREREELEQRERQERVVSEMCRRAAEACRESFEAEIANKDAATKEKLKRATFLEEALINKFTEEANDIADIEKVMQRRKRSLKQSLELLPEHLRPKISFENEVSSNTNHCVICQQQDAIMAVVPCGHTCLCAECSSSIMANDKKCPLCRTDIEKIVKIYTGNN